MRKGLIILAVFVVLLGLVGAAGVFAAPKVLKAAYPLPENEVTFPHDFHATTLGLECEFCHRAAETSRAATAPGLEQCMFCHKAVGLANPRAQIVRAAWESGEPLDWIRQYRLPDHTQFQHEPHITAGVACSVCHGDVGAMGQVEPARTLKMGDCVGCHKQNGAPTQCAICHT
ncbi:MAG: cytochrome c3 family protein [Chloroflexi bacterium]|nr:cytochrome c3 family protein [Chloroflexota bacterium]